MTLVRFNNKPAKSFNNLVDDFFTQMPSLFRDDFSTTYGRHAAPVNITETEQDFVLELVAPGLEKEDFKINLEQNNLTISAERKPVAPEAKVEGKQIMKEYSFASFKRSFTIDEKIDATNIVAKYTNGVLTLNLPKKAEVKEAAKHISIQ
jgi:HSP20 family protein